MWTYNTELKMWESTYENPALECGIHCELYATDDVTIAHAQFMCAVDYWQEQTYDYDNEQLTFFPKIEKYGKWFYIYTTIVAKGYQWDFNPPFHR